MAECQFDCNFTTCTVSAHGNVLEINVRQGVQLNKCGIVIICMQDNFPWRTSELKFLGRRAQLGHNCHDVSMTREVFG